MEEERKEGGREGRMPPKKSAKKYILVKFIQISYGKLS
jgi:hypothetical protein